MDTLIGEIKSDPSHYNSLYKKHYKALQQKYPEIDSKFWYDYWATRLSVLDQGNTILQFDTLEEPNKITITINPDYSS